MRKNISIDESQTKKHIEDIYNYFKTGYEFEEFLKIYLEKLGLDEVSVTQRSRDGGVDLKAVRNGFGGFSDADLVEYYVQAKRYKPDKSISVSKIRELKGTIPFGHKGIFITTASFSRDAEKEAINDPSKPVILIDGKKLIESCIDNEIGFVFSPRFSKSAMDELSEQRGSETELSLVEDDSCHWVERQITTNDIRARILVIPRDILNKIPVDVFEVKVSVNGSQSEVMKINQTRRYLGGVTDVFRDNGLIMDDGSSKEKKAKWNIAGDTIIIKIV